MASRSITGTLFNAPRAVVRFRQLAAFVTTSATYLAGTHTAATNDAGAFAIALPVPDSGSVPYRIELPDGTAADLYIGAGDATTLELLLASAFAASSSPDVLAVLASLLDAHALVKASTTVLGHVKIDGSTILIDGNGVISSVGGGGGGAPSGPAGGVLGGTYPNPAFAADMATQAELDAEASTRASADTTNANNLTTHAALTTTAHGGIVASTDPRLTDSRAPTAHASTHASAGSDPITLAESQITGLVADLAAKQPLDADLTAIAAIATTAFGRALLALADAAALRTAGGLGSLATLSAITASLISDASANGRSLITATDYAAMRTLLGLVIGTNVQAWDADLDTLAGMGSTRAALLAAATVNANTALLGPVSGAAAAPTQRALVSADGTALNDGANGALIDHFFAVVGATSAGPLWLSTGTSGTGAGVSFIQPPDTTAFGVEQMTTGTTTTGRAGLQTNANAIRFGGGAFDLSWRFQLPTILDGTESGAIYVGFGDGLAAAPVDGAYLYWDNTQANIRYRTRSNSTETDVDSGLAFAAGTWYTVRIQVNAAANSAIFTVNGGNSQTIATNIPTGSGRETGLICNIIKSAGTTARLLYADFARLAWSGF